jgi:uncharacterized protein
MKQKFLLLLLYLIFLSCSPSLKTYKEHYSEINERILKHDYAGAIQLLEASKDKMYQKKDRVVYYLDLGMLYHYNGQYQKSNETLTMAEREIEELYTKSISRAAASFLLNDNVLDYAGEDYEDLYVNVFKAINYLELDDFEAAFVEIRRMYEKTKQLDSKHNKLAKELNRFEDAKIEMEPGESNFHNSALSNYLSMLMYRTEEKYDDAAIDYRKYKEAWETQSHIYNFPMPDNKKSILKTNDAKVNVLAFAGKAPDKKAKTLYVHTEKDMIIIGTTEENPRGRNDLASLNVFPWEGVKKGYHFKLQLPYLEKQDSQVERIKILVDNEEKASLELIESINNIATETYKLKEPIIYIKTIIRAVVKGLFVAKRKQEMESKIDNPLLGFAARMVTDMAVDATENADLRISRFFPGKVYTSEILLPAGFYDIKVQYYGAHNTLLFVDEYPETEIKKNELNLISSSYLR